MSAALYTRDILRLAVSIPHQSRLDKPDGTAEARSRACGSRVTADINLLHDRSVSELGIEVNACALGQASAAIMATEVIGKSQEEIAMTRQQLADFLGGVQDSPGEWKNMNHLVAAKEHKGRHAAILLPYDAILAAFEAAATKEAAA